MIYLDSAAVVKLVHAEAESPALRAWLDERAETAWISSVLTEIESFRALARYAPDAVSLLPAVLDQIDLIGLDPPVRILAQTARPATVRSLDAIHLGTALHIRRTLTSFVTYDRRLLDVARNAGLPVDSPAQPAPATAQPEETGPPDIQDQLSALLAEPGLMSCVVLADIPIPGMVLLAEGVPEIVEGGDRGDARAHKCCECGRDLGGSAEDDDDAAGDRQCDGHVGSLVIACVVASESRDESPIRPVPGPTRAKSLVVALDWFSGPVWSRIWRLAREPWCDDS